MHQISGRDTVTVIFLKPYKILNLLAQKVVEIFALEALLS